MKYLFTIILLASFYIGRTQDAIKVFSAGNCINKLTTYNQKVYFVSYGEGLVIYDSQTGTSVNYNISNTPMRSNRVYSVQVINEDTLLVNEANGVWLVTNGYWSEISNSGIADNVIIASDRTIFRYNQGQTLDKLVNNSWQPITDTGASAVSNILLNNDNNNNLYSNKNYYYKDGHWQITPTIVDATYTYQRDPFPVCDNLSNQYFVRNKPGTNQYKIYMYDGVQFTAYNIPLNETYQSVIGVYTDSLNNHTFFISTSNSSNAIPPKTFVWNGVSVNAEQLNISVGIGINGNQGTVSYINGKYFIGQFGFYVSDSLPYFTPIQHGNTCAYDYLMPQMLESQDTFYISGGDRWVYKIDTSFTYCEKFDSIDAYNNSNDTRYLSKDNHGEIWRLTQNGRAIKNLKTGAVKSLNSLSANFTTANFSINNDTVWVTGTLDTFGFGINTGYKITPTTTTQSSFACDYIDKYGVRWYEIYDNNDSFKIVKVSSETETTVKSLYHYYLTAQGLHKLCLDNEKNVWIMDDNSIVRYSGSNSLITYTIPLPLSVNRDNYIFQVIDSSEAILVANDVIQYFSNGAWRYFNTPFIPVYSAGIYSFGNGKIAFFTNLEGIVVYDLNKTPYSNGSILSGNLFNDWNSNNTFDVNDLVFSGKSVTINNAIYSSNSVGRYLANVSNGTYHIVPPAITYYQVSPDSLVITANTSNIDTLNFKYTPTTPVQDLEFHFTPIDFVLSYYGTLYLSVKNTGTQIASPTLTINFDTALNVLSSQLPVISQNPGSVTLQVGQLYPGEYVNRAINFNVSSFCDSLITFTGLVNPILQDSTPLNNYDSITVEVVSSYDPNEKIVEPTGYGAFSTIDTGQLLTYTIKFQNTGTYKAYNVVLTDTLSAKLNINTFNYLSSSHGCTYSINNHILIITFKNINLPFADENEFESHGYFKFSIKPTSQVVYGDSISNKASIYFDSNEPIITNKAQVAFGEIVLSNGKPLDKGIISISAFPQPFSNSFTLHLSNSVNLPCNLQMFNSLGQLVLEKKINGINESVKTTQIASGTYTIRVIDNQKQQFTTNCIKVK